jgi:DtxR family Mn-dependent transcriptional regulator
LRDFFANVLAVDGAAADEAACRMEHSIPPLILERFMQFAEFIGTCPRGGERWVAGFWHQCEHGVPIQKCEKCISLTLEDVKKRERGGKKTMTAARVPDLRLSQKGKVLKITARGEARRRIVATGVEVGALIEVERIAPVDDLIDIRVRGYHVSLRKEDARRIEVEIIS